MALIATPLATTDSHEMCLTRWQMRPPPTSEVLGLPIMNEPSSITHQTVNTANHQQVPNLVHAPCSDV